MSDATQRSVLPPRRGARVYLAGSLVGQACALLRYTILARLLGPEQLGLVATLILVSNFFEMISDTASDRFLVQDRRGDEPDVQRLVQAVFASRGAFMALGLAVAAIPVANYFQEPALIAGLAILGLSPLIGGLMHLDVRRFQRRNDFRAEGLGLIVAELVGLIATIVAALLTRDFTATLYGLILRSAALVVMSHVSAERPYGWGYASEAASRLRTFAIPLVANGALLFVAGQSDRIMVSTLAGLEALGHYTAALLLVLYPTVALTRYMQGIHLPLVAAESGSTHPNGTMNLLGGRSLLLAIGIAAGFAVVGPLAIVILYGGAFAQPLALVGMIGILQAARFIRVWPTTQALGLGRSRIVLASSLARTLGIPAAALGFFTLGGIHGIVAGFILGELVALLVGVLGLNRGRALPWWHEFDRIAAFAIACALIEAALLAVQYQSLLGFAVAPAAVLWGVWLLRRERATLSNGVGAVTRILGRAR